MNDVLVSAVSMGLLGTVFGLGLMYASSRFKVETDPRVEEVAELAPGANCGACGFSGCHAFAEAVVTGKAPMTGCPVGGNAFAEKIAAVLGEAIEEMPVRQVAHVKCGGCNDKAKSRGEYEGATDCWAAMLHFGGPKECMYGCLGLGSCVRACQFDAMWMNPNGLPEVDEDKCTACGKCVEACPRRLVELVPVTGQVHVRCKSKDPGKVVRKVCEVGCIGCGLCVKACAYDAIAVTDHLAAIDYEKCTNCGECARKCPTQAIIIQEFKAGSAEKLAG